MEGNKQFNDELQVDNNNPLNNSNPLEISQEVYADKRTTGEKVAVGAIIVTAFFAVILGYSQMARSVKSPFADLLIVKSANEDCIGGDCQLQAQILAVLEQQQTDTDGDGLSDYDELNVYQTSPYLADTDSDGFTDKQEVDQGDDPNCVGENCFRNSDTPESSGSSLLNVQDLMSGQSSPSVLRSLLLDQGFPQETLDNISDADLMAIYQESLSGQSDSSTVTGAPISSDTDLTSVDNLKGLTGEQIRQLMIEQGAPAELLLQIDDATLQAMFLSQLNAKTN